MSGPARLRRTAVLVALWAYVLGTLLGTAHLALTEHRVCADHGEIVHGEPACATAPAAPSVAVDELAADCPSFLAADASEEHEHCRTAFALRSDRRIETPPAAACGAPPALARAPDRAALLRVQDDRLSFAPKQSPPA
jgi:hypothetical protein